MQMWFLGTWFSGRLGGARLTVGLNDIRGIFLNLSDSVSLGILCGKFGCESHPIGDIFGFSWLPMG